MYCLIAYLRKVLLNYKHFKGLINNLIFSLRIQFLVFMFRFVKLGWNPWVNPGHHGSGWVEIFLQTG